MSEPERVASTTEVVLKAENWELCRKVERLEAALARGEAERAAAICATCGMSAADHHYAYTEAVRMCDEIRAERDALRAAPTPSAVSVARVESTDEYGHTVRVDDLLAFTRWPSGVVTVRFDFSPTLSGSRGWSADAWAALVQALAPPDAPSAP